MISHKNLLWSKCTQQESISCKDINTYGQHGHTEKEKHLLQLFPTFALAQQEVIHQLLPVVFAVCCLDMHQKKVTKKNRHLHLL
jgi:hypothetical protein